MEMFRSVVRKFGNSSPRNFTREMSSALHLIWSRAMVMFNRSACLGHFDELDTPGHSSHTANVSTGVWAEHAERYVRSLGMANTGRNSGGISMIDPALWRHAGDDVRVVRLVRCCAFICQQV